MTRILVTGAAGKAGRAIIAELLEHGYDITAADVVAPRVDIGAEVILSDMLDVGQVFELLAGVDGVVHMAGIPGTRIVTPISVFNRNTLTTTNVFQAAAQLEVPKVVWASSETILGYDFTQPPKYVPIDDEHGPYPTHPYALSKLVCEVAAEHISTWSKTSFFGMRFSWIQAAEEYRFFEEWQDDPFAHKWNLWGYIDSRDAASAVRLALESPLTGSHNMFLAAADTVMRRPSLDLLNEVFPGTPTTRPLAGRDALGDCSTAARLLGWGPKYSWLDQGSE